MRSQNYRELISRYSSEHTVNQLLREVLPVIIPLMAPRPIGRPTVTSERKQATSYRSRLAGQNRVPSHIEEYVRKRRHGGEEWFGLNR
jgi:hypothetical protein